MAHNVCSLKACMYALMCACILLLCCMIIILHACNDEATQVLEVCSVPHGKLRDDRTRNQRMEWLERLPWCLKTTCDSEVFPYLSQ